MLPPKRYEILIGGGRIQVSDATDNPKEPRPVMRIDLFDEFAAVPEDTLRKFIGDLLRVANGEQPIST